MVVIQMRLPVVIIQIIILILIQVYYQMHLMCKFWCLFIASIEYVYFSFAQFFLSPLFAASSTDRELEAVNSEYEGNLFKDVWRISQLEKSTSDPQHPYSGFSIGNSESLRTTPKQRGIDIRQVLLDFHKAEYSSNRMSLAVLGNRMQFVSFEI
jgi:hypothetical protein